VLADMLTLCEHSTLASYLTPPVNKFTGFIDPNDEGEGDEL